MMSDTASVLFVNEAFYDAFRTRDLATMDRLWSRQASVACIHPGWQALTDREEVMDSWEGILGGDSAREVYCLEPRAYIMGQIAFVICYEQIGEGVLVATNIFAKEGNDWRLVHHQAGPCNATAVEVEMPDEPDDYQ